MPLFIPESLGENPRIVIFSSYGNDSLALIYTAYVCEWTNVDVVYSDTGWAAKWWPERVARMESWVTGLGFRPVRIQSVGMEALVKARKGWARQGMQFCTSVLKIEPAVAWLDSVDPDKRAVCCVGVRREESAARSNTPIWRNDSPAHGGRTLFAPLAEMTRDQVGQIVTAAGFGMLPHRSKECFPCINDNREDIRMLDEDTISRVERVEAEMGHTRNGKARTMFRPYRHMGATGIREVVRWAHSAHGAFSLDDGTAGGDCGAGMCGS